MTALRFQTGGDIRHPRPPFGGVVVVVVIVVIVAAAAAAGAVVLVSSPSLLSSLLKVGRQARLRTPDTTS